MARIVGDAFLIVLRDMQDLVGAALPAQETFHVLSITMPVEDTALEITTSMGIAI